MINKNTFAPTAPMGWNSWDCYGAAAVSYTHLTLKNVKVLAKKGGEKKRKEK